MYKSGNIHGQEQAAVYSKLDISPHRFLAYRDFSNLTKGLIVGKKALDLGSGTGASTKYLSNKGFEVTGLDISEAMIAEAKKNYPELNFQHITGKEVLGNFDLVFSSFVMFELSSKEKIIDYLDLAAENLKSDGLFFGVTGSEFLHSRTSNWNCFNVDYDQNNAPSSGDMVKLSLKEHELEFVDYFWKEKDYKECFKSSRLELLNTYYPLGLISDPFDWKDETNIPPFVVFIAKKSS